MFILLDTGRINMRNVEEFMVVAESNISYQLQVRFVSGTERVLFTGTMEQCHYQLGLIMASYTATTGNT